MPREMVSIIVPCRNEAPHIKTFLTSVQAQQTADLDLEIIIADGESTDGTRQILDEWRKTDPRITVIENQERFVSNGLNRAIRASRGEIILRMDVHTCYAPDYIRQCVQTLKATGAGNVGGRRANSGRGRNPAGHRGRLP